MVVDLEGEADAPQQAVHRPRLGLGRRAGAAVGLARRIRRGALVVVVPVRREVAVEVDAVAARDLPVAVDVAQVLAPQAVAGREGEVVAVGVGRDHEPQLGRVDDLGDAAAGLVRLAVLVEHVVQEPAGHLRRDPLARVLVGRVQDRGPASVADRARVARDLERQDRHSAQRLADLDDLDQAGMRGRHALQLLVERLARVAARVGADVRLVPVGPVDVVGAVGAHARGAGGGGPRAARREPEALQLRGLAGGRGDLDRPARAALGHVVALAGELLQGAGVGLDAIRVQPAAGRGR